MQGIYQKGMTLIELTVVLLILIALAGLALPYMGGTSSKALCNATDVSMANIKKVIMNGYYLDTLGKFPQNLDGLSVATGGVSVEYNLHYLFSQKNLVGDRVHKAFDPDSAIGWRDGGYLQNGLVLKSDKTTGNFDDSDYTDPLKEDHIVVIDSWGRPIVIQVEIQAGGTCPNWGISTTESHCTRLVSAGQGSGLSSDEASIDTKIAEHRGGDDRVLYLNVPTPADDINPSCGS